MDSLHPFGLPVPSPKLIEVHAIRAHVWTTNEQLRKMDRQTRRDTEAALMQRSIAIRNLVENILPLAKENIEKAQKKQRESRNRRNWNIRTESLETGNKVFIRVTNKLKSGKLGANNRGPYTVDKRTEHGNYYLLTKNNTTQAIQSARPARSCREHGLRRRDDRGRDRRR